MMTTVTPTPIPSPSVAGAVVQAAPWWGVPLLAGTFLLLGALIAFTSTYFSDRRKLTREDQRQWDKEVRDLYVQMAEQVSRVAGTRQMAELDVREGKAYEISTDALQQLESQLSALSLIAQPRTLKVAQQLKDTAGGITGLLHDRMKPSKEMYRELHVAQTEFLKAVKTNLRIPNME